MTIIKVLLKSLTQELRILNTSITLFHICYSYESALICQNNIQKTCFFPPWDFYFCMTNKMILLLAFKNDIKMTQQSGGGENEWEAD